MKFTSVIPYLLLTMIADHVTTISASPLSLSLRDVTKRSSDLIHEPSDTRVMLQVLGDPPNKCTSSDAQRSICQTYLNQLSSIFGRIEDEFDTLLNKISKLDVLEETKGWLPLQEYRKFHETASMGLATMGCTMLFDYGAILAREAYLMIRYYGQTAASVRGIKEAFRTVMQAHLVDTQGLISHERVGEFCFANDDRTIIDNLESFSQVYLKMQGGSK